MNSSLYIGATGMKSLSEGMNVITNNLANVNTVGYKQQDALFSDLIYQDQGAVGTSWQEDSKVAIGQVGMGVQLDTVRTIFNQGGFESGSSVTDLALSGNGFFQVVDDEGQEFYTRSGNFFFNSEGVLSLPSGEYLSGYPISEDGSKGALGQIKVDPFEVMPAKSTTSLSMGFNLGDIEDTSSSTSTDPFFSLAKEYTASNFPPLSEGQYSYSQTVRIYDANGEAQNLTLYVDKAPSAANSTEDVMEFLVASDADADSPTGQALLTGTLTFDSSGQIIDMTAFSPTGDTTDLSNWTPAAMSGGKPVINYNGQSIAFDVGITSNSGAWSNAPASAAAVGTDASLLGSMGEVTVAADATSAFNGSNSMHKNVQDGYMEGHLTNLEITQDGTVVGSYSNSQSKELYEIPIARFTSNDGLYREGGNLFSYTDAAGQMDLGKAGTGNYASMLSYNLETSNVEMSAEMVDMIITQRGFQSNSKVVTTADEMLKKAMEIKRA